MTVHLVRHAAHPLLPHTLAGRSPDVPLSADGIRQAEQLAAGFAGQPVAAVLSSPVQRAVETAARIAGALALGIEIEAGFEELDFGRWTGSRFDTLAHDPAWHAWNRLRSFAGTPGGETMTQAQSRALTALGRCRHRFVDQAIVVVSHADIIKAVLAPALGLPLDRLYRLTIDPASVSTLVLFDEDVRVDGVNRRP